MTWETEEEYTNGVEVRINRDNNPHVVAVFDEGEKVTDNIAVLQIEEVKWEAAGYSVAKGKYQ